jgi:signal transduction histidine kinase/CheY-like chemotaxis protein
MRRRDPDLAPFEMKALVRAFDWSATPLGPMATWPANLRTTVDILLHSRHPMFLWWGPELVQIYNDAYRPSLGIGKHPMALGQRGRDCWEEIWPIIWPQLDDVMSRGQPSWNEDALVPIFRNGRIEEVYWTYGYSPVLDEVGAVAGTLVVCTETTSRVIADRRRRALREVNEQTVVVTELGHLLPRTAEALTAHTHDLPFALLFETDQVSGATTSRRAVHLDDVAAAVIEAAVRPHLADLPRRVALGDPGDAVRLPGGAWPEPATEVFVTRVARSGKHATTFAVFGLSPRLTFDDAYRDFLLQLSEQIGNARVRIEAWRTRAVVESERNNLLLQAPMATALMTGPEHVFQLANPLYHKLVGREDLVGRSYLGAFPELVDTALPGILDRVYRSGEPFVTSELLVPLDRHGQGVIEDCYFKFNLEPLRDAGGDVYGMLAIAVDITEQVLARRALEQAGVERELLLADLRAVSRTKDEFLAMLGHELRNPLSPIVTAIELMKLGGSDHAAGLQLVERQVQHLIHLVDDLLDVARITRGQLELVRAPVELAIVAERAIETASTQIESGGHVLSVDVPADGLVIDADVVRMAQVIANLLVNAAKYTPPSGHIWVDARRDGHDAVLRVRDDGVGIAPDMLEDIFSLFTQVPQDLGRSQGGLGLGLSIVKMLTEKHGGTVSARSAGRGHGSEFTVRLPLAVQTPASVEPAAPTAPEGPELNGRGRPRRRILIVDDNEDAAWILAESLSHIGHDVQCAHDGPSALRVALEHVPEIALLDIGLPVMDGYELASRLQAQPGISGIRLIALTGYGQAGDRQRSNDAGFAAHLVKPISLDALVKAIDVVL